MNAGAWFEETQYLSAMISTGKLFTDNRYWFMGLLWLLLLTANGWIARNKSAGFEFKNYVTYDEVYVAAEMQYIQSLKIENDRVVIELSKPLPGINGWPYLLDDSIKGMAKVVANELSFPVPAGKHRYLFSKAGVQMPAFQIMVDNACRSDSAGCLNELNFCSLPMPERRPMTLNNWWNAHEFSATDMEQGRSLLLLNEASESMEANAAVIAAITSRMATGNNHEDVSEVLQNKTNPASQVRKAIDEQLKLNCGHFTFFVHFLSNSIGIANRPVMFMDDAKKWSHAVHYLNEVYVPEKNQWGLIDATNNLYLPQDSSGRLLNTADIANLMASGSLLTSLVAYGVEAGKWQQMPLSKWYSQLRQYYANPYSTISYWDVRKPFEKNNFLGKLKRFYGFDKTRLHLSNRYRNDWGKIFVKLACFYGFILITTITVFGLMQQYRRHSRARKSL